MASPKVVTIIQARSGSTRFPRKMMADLHGKPMLEWVLHRCLLAKTVDDVVLATTDLSRDDGLVDIANECGVPVFRGDEEDVLGRFAKAANMAEADTIVRVCGDRPLVDPDWTDLAVNHYQADRRIDLAFNHISGEKVFWPRGFGVEVFSATVLHQMDQNQRDPFCREHVTPYIWKNQDKYRVEVVPCPVVMSPDVRFDVDTEQDLDFVRSHTNAEQIDIPAREILTRYSTSNG